MSWRLDRRTERHPSAHPRGNALIDVGGFTLLGRLSDETVLARMFAGFEGVLTHEVAAGILVTPVIIDGLVIRASLVAIGLLARSQAWWPGGRCGG